MAFLSGQGDLPRGRRIDPRRAGGSRRRTFERLEGRLVLSADIASALADLADVDPADIDRPVEQRGPALIHEHAPESHEAVRDSRDGEVVRASASVQMPELTSIIERDRIVETIDEPLLRSHEAEALRSASESTATSAAIAAADVDRISEVVEDQHFRSREDARGHQGGASSVVDDFDFESLARSSSATSSNVLAEAVRAAEPSPERQAALVAEHGEAPASRVTAAIADGVSPGSIQRSAGPEVTEPIVDVDSTLSNVLARASAGAATAGSIPTAVRVAVEALANLELPATAATTPSSALTAIPLSPTSDDLGISLAETAIDVAVTTEEPAAASAEASGDVGDADTNLVTREADRPTEVASAEATDIVAGESSDLTDEASEVRDLLERLYTPETHEDAPPTIVDAPAGDAPLVAEAESSVEGGMVLLPTPEALDAESLLLIDEAFADQDSEVRVALRMKPAMGAYQAFDIASLGNRGAVEGPLGGPAVDAIAGDATPAAEVQATNSATPTLLGAVASVAASLYTGARWRRSKTPKRS